MWISRSACGLENKMLKLEQAWAVEKVKEGRDVERKKERGSIGVCVVFLQQPVRAGGLTVQTNGPLN